ncbi:MAG: DUF423 domain-containing protein [Prolixibacteraceae bacterium]
MSKTILIAGSGFLALAVIIGAFGAHALKAKLLPEMLQVYKTGVEYHFYHALGLLFVGILSLNISSGLITWSAICLMLGIVLFSGSLYLMAITGIKWLGAITPLGGLSFIAGWVLLLIAVWKKLPV